jgi:NADPH:quinone reductase-like Zn-dependent oxidoreductase
MHGPALPGNLSGANSCMTNLPKNMVAIELSAPGGPEMLHPQTVALPELRPGEVLIRVAAAGINAPDLQQRRGRYDPPPGASLRLGLEVGGEIAALGEGATRFATGDRADAHRAMELPNHFGKIVLVTKFGAAMA